MSIRFRKGLPVLPFLRLNLSRSGVSWTFHAGPWSWNSRRRRNRVDLPGPLSWEQDRRRGQRGSGRSIAVVLIFAVALMASGAIGVHWLWTHAAPYLHHLTEGTAS
jgi:hypothetical protein